MRNPKGNSVCRVMYDSKKPAMINIGTVPSTILTPLVALLLKETNREYVFGKSHPFPIVIPAAPATMIAEISSVPCVQIDNADSPNKPCS